MSLFPNASLGDPSNGSRSLFGYELLERLGEGAGSIIHAVSHSQTNQIYALKHVVRKAEKDIRFVEQLEAEFHVGQKISHPNVRRVVDFQIKKTLLGKVTEAVLVLELFDGAPLDAALPNDLLRLVNVFIQTANALDAMHIAGFVHCDLKPNNILLGSRRTVKVIDLGQACLIGTEKTRIQGTPDYISPEQVKCRPVTPQTDVYSLGATMYWALTGKKMPTLFTASKGDNSFLMDTAVPSPHELNEEVPEQLSKLVMECVRANSKKRPENMAEIIRRLETIHFAMERHREQPMRKFA